MAEEQIGTPDGDTQVKAEDAGADTGTPEFYVASYKDKDAAEAGILEKDQAISRLSNEINNLKKGESRKQAELMERVVALQESQSRSAEPEYGPTNGVMEQLREKLQDIDPEGNIEATLQSIAVGAKEYSDAKVKASIEPLAAQLTEATKALNEMRLQSDPDYLARKELVDTLTGSGVDMAKAIAAAKVVQPTVQPAAPAAPGHAGGGKVIDSKSTKTLLEQTPEARAFLKDVMKMTDAEIDASEAREKAALAKQRSA